MHVTEGRDRWRPLVNTVTDVRVLLKEGNFLTSWTSSVELPGFIPMITAFRLLPSAVPWPERDICVSVTKCSVIFVRWFVTGSYLVLLPVHLRPSQPSCSEVRVAEGLVVCELLLPPACRTERGAEWGGSHLVSVPCGSPQDTRTWPAAPAVDNVTGQWKSSLPGQKKKVTSTKIAREVGLLFYSPYFVSAVFLA